MVSLLGSCNDTKVVQKEDILVKFGEHYLFKAEVENQIPSVMSGVDSVRLAEALVMDWINMQLMTEVALRNERDEKQINELVKRYRNNLIVEQYRRNMIMENDSLMIVNEDSISNYYNENKEQLRLSSPVVKGAFVKIAADAAGADLLKKVFRSDKVADRDSVGRILAMEAISYDLFYDRWILWESVETVIPYDFGNVDAFLKGNKYMEFTANGFLYLLDIAEYVESKKIMPYEYAKEVISDLFVLRNQRAYDDRLKVMMYDEALNSGELEIYK